MATNSCRKVVKYFAVYSLLMLTSCSESKQILENMSAKKVSLAYLHDSKIAQCDKSIPVALVNLSGNAIGAETTVEKYKQVVLPFLVFNSHKVIYDVNLGRNLLKQNYSYFFQESFTTETRRGGCYTLNNSPSSPYALEITLLNSSITAQYTTNMTVLFLLLAYSIHTNESCSPAETVLNVNARLKRGEQVVLEKRYAIKKSTPFIPGRVSSVEVLRRNAMLNMGESLSLSTKECIEQIIQDVNIAIEKDRAQATENGEQSL